MTAPRRPSDTFVIVADNRRRLHSACKGRPQSQATQRVPRYKTMHDTRIWLGTRARPQPPTAGKCRTGSISLRPSTWPLLLLRRQGLAACRNPPTQRSRNHVGGTEHATKSRHARYSAGTESIEFDNPTFSARLEHLDIYIILHTISTRGKRVERLHHTH